MGAYSFLARRIGMRKTEEMMLSGNTYRAEELANMGIVDIVAPRGEGENAVRELIRKKNRHLNGMRSIYECRNHLWPITFEELREIALMWVDAALRVSDKDLQMMTQLAMAQRSLHAKYQQSMLAEGSPSDQLQVA
jgi:DSF synthase